MERKMEGERNRDGVKEGSSVTNNIWGGGGRMCACVIVCVCVCLSLCVYPCLRRCV